MTYTIKEIADLAGISTRTLRYYDEISLLPPAGKGENGYRWYDEKSLLVLQQILFFRELEMPLEEIRRIIHGPDFNILRSLQEHKSALMLRREKIQQLMKTIDRTIDNMKGNISMSPKDLFEGFEESKYREEAAARWGGTSQYKESKKKWSSYSDAQKEAIKVEGGRIFVKMVGNEQSMPHDADVQAAVGEYYKYLTKNFYSCNLEFLQGLAEGWVSDERFSEVFERIRQGGAAFARDAVKVYVENQNK
jgi:DNA-binding transcriptional MerR regulator